MWEYKILYVERKNQENIEQQGLLFQPQQIWTGTGMTDFWMSNTEANQHSFATASISVFEIFLPHQTNTVLKK